MQNAPLNLADPLGLYGVPSLPGMFLVSGAFITIGGSLDVFAVNWLALLEANRLGVRNADKYFHCMANCESTKRGPAQQLGAVILSNLKEAKDLAFGPYGPADSARDQAANRYGRECPHGRPCSGHCGLLLTGWLPHP